MGMGTWGKYGGQPAEAEREKHRPGDLAVAEMSPALAEVAGLAASATCSLTTASIGRGGCDT